MVRGIPIDFVLTPTNLGVPVTDPEIVNGIELVLASSASKVPVKRYTIGSGITSLGEGRYRVVVTAEDTLLMPPSGRAIMQGWTLPIRKGIKPDLGDITDNFATRKTAEENA